MPIVLKSTSLKLLETSVPVQACNGIALSFSSVILRPISGLLSSNISKQHSDLIFKGQITGCLSTEDKITMQCRNICQKIPRDGKTILNAPLRKPKNVHLFITKR